MDSRDLVNLKFRSLQLNVAYRRQKQGPITVSGVEIGAAGLKFRDWHFWLVGEGAGSQTQAVEAPEKKYSKLCRTFLEFEEKKKPCAQVTQPNFMLLVDGSGFTKTLFALAEFCRENGTPKEEKAGNQQ